MRREREYSPHDFPFYRFGIRERRHRLSFDYIHLFPASNIQHTIDFSAMLDTIGDVKNICFSVFFKDKN